MQIRESNSETNRKHLLFFNLIYTAKMKNHKKYNGPAGTVNSQDDHPHYWYLELTTVIQNLNLFLKILKLNVKLKYLNH